jgi:hypothetical protein
MLWDGHVKTRSLDTSGSKQGQEDLRFGNLGTTIAFGKGQSEMLHLDRGDCPKTYTLVMVFGDGEWDTSKGQGDLVLPTLGWRIPLQSGDVVHFQACNLPHYVLALDEVDRDKRVVVTLFSCEQTKVYLDKHVSE